MIHRKLDMEMTLEVIKYYLFYMRATNPEMENVLLMVTQRVHKRVCLALRPQTPGQAPHVTSH